MPKFKVMVEVEVEADSESDAFHCVESAVENMTGGDIIDASVSSVAEQE